MSQRRLQRSHARRHLDSQRPQSRSAVTEEPVGRDRWPWPSAGKQGSTCRRSGSVQEALLRGGCLLLIVLKLGDLLAGLLKLDLTLSQHEGAHSVCLAD